MVDEKKYLILFNGRFVMDRYFIKNVDNEQVKITPMYQIYKKNFKFLLAVLWMEKLKLPFESVWYGKWKKEIKQYDIVIVNAQNLSWEILNYIKKKNPTCRLIVWYWDTVNEKNMLPNEYKKNCEVWSFDEKDCEKFSMKLNSQLYLTLDILESEFAYDAMFIGRDKGRTEKINEICGILQKKGLKVYVYVQDDKINKEWFRKKNKKEIEYEDVIGMVAKSKCVIDVPKKGQTGITMRVLESIFYSKKLITTDSDIKNCEFYNKNNIFIWGEDNLENIVTFINGEFQPISENIKKKYLFEEWLKKFEGVKE